MVPQFLKGLFMLDNFWCLQIRTLLQQVQEGVLQLLKASPIMTNEMISVVSDKMRDIKWHIFPMHMEGVKDMDSIFEKARDISSSRVLDGFFTLSSLALQSRWSLTAPPPQSWTFLDTSPFYDVFRNILGWQVDSSGYFRAWWSESARNVYQRRTFCLAKQYVDNSHLPA
ncbi:uncharacterized protein LOC144167980 [Haemaphysalis longicornis]